MSRGLVSRLKNYFNTFDNLDQFREMLNWKKSTEIGNEFWKNKVIIVDTLKCISQLRSKHQPHPPSHQWWDNSVTGHVGWHKPLWVPIAGYVIFCIIGGIQLGTNIPNWAKGKKPNFSGEQKNVSYFEKW